MRIAIVSHNVVKGKGQGRVNYELTRHLLDQDIRVTLVANEVDSALVDAGAEWEQVRLDAISHTIDLVKEWRFKRKADRWLRRSKSQFDAILGCGVVLTIPHAINAVHFVHSAWRQSPYHPIRNRVSMNSLYQWMVAKANSHWEQQTLQNAERIISVSDKIRSEVLDLGIPPERVKTIHNGVDLNTFHPGTADRENLGLPADVPLAFFAGDIQSSRKNLDTVLRALRETPSTHLAVAGRLPGSPYPALAEKVGVDDRVHFLGFRSDVADLMRAADFFVFPSRYEACTLVLLEAMASGLPVVTASTTGGSELVTEKNGFVVQDPEDVARLTEHIRTLSEDCSLREDMGERSRTIANRHSWKRMSEEYLSAINTHT